MEDLFTSDEHVQVEATWGIYQRIVVAYREPDKTRGKQMMRAVIDAITSGAPYPSPSSRSAGSAGH